MVIVSLKSKKILISSLHGNFPTVQWTHSNHDPETFLFWVLTLPCCVFNPNPGSLVDNSLGGVQETQHASTFLKHWPTYILFNSTCLKQSAAFKIYSRDLWVTEWVVLYSYLGKCMQPVTWRWYTVNASPSSWEFSSWHKFGNLSAFTQYDNKVTHEELNSLWASRKRLIQATHPPEYIYVEAVLPQEGQVDCLDVFRSLGQSQRLLLLNRVDRVRVELTHPLWGRND